MNVSFQLGALRTSSLFPIVDETKAATELYLVTFLVFNALARPRTITQGLFGMLVNDGLLFFVVRVFRSHLLAAKF